MVFTTKTRTTLYVVGVFIVLITTPKLFTHPTHTVQDNLPEKAHSRKTACCKQKSNKRKKHSFKKKHHIKRACVAQAIDAKQESKKRVLKEVRHNIIAHAKKFLEHPFITTNNQVLKEAKHSSKKHKRRPGRHIDCSELVQRSYASSNLSIPRTARMQFLKCNKIKENVAERLKPADLIFTARAKHPERIDHVMMYMGNGILIESTGAHGKVRIIPIKRRSGRFLSELPFGKRSGKYVYYYGTFFKKKTKQNTPVERESQESDNIAHQPGDSKEEA